MDKRDGTKKKKAIDGDQKWQLELFRVNTQIGIIVDKGFLCAELQIASGFSCSRAGFQRGQPMVNGGGRTRDLWVA